ncbi:MAG: hypothetical protein GVY36_01715, partial [Verrucomicrobia bacterium]|nr:hypothetical protein [Verrucomicrobiota bacterium]
KGDTAELDTIDLKVSNGTAGHKDLELVFDGLTASATGAEQVDFRLTGWELSGESALTDFGEVSASGGDVELSLDGPWQAWLPDFNPTGLGLRVKMAKAPLSLFTGQGSASGSSQINSQRTPIEFSKNS